jgi:hypothetical protein
VNRRALYLALCVIGTILPYSQFLPFFVERGIDLPLFLDQSFANRVAGGGTFDLLVSSVVLWVFVFSEGRRLGIKHLWMPVLANFAVGVSLGLPLFLYMREMRTADAPGQS